MQPSDLRVALFSGNYNYVRDGANQALNLLVEHLLGRGVAVRVYSPTTDSPAFPPRGDLVDDAPRGGERSACDERPMRRSATVSNHDVPPAAVPCAKRNACSRGATERPRS